MEIVELKADRRLNTGRKGAKECRDKGLLPGIFYGKGDEPIPVAVIPRQLDKALNTHAGSNVVIQLTVGEDGGEPANVVVKELQVDAIKGTMRHVDFCHIFLDEKIRTTVRFQVVGEAPGVKEGGILEHIMWDLEVEGLPLDIPDFIEVDVSELDIGDSLSVGTLTVPETVTVLSDAAATLITVAAPRVEEEEVVEEELEEGIEGEEPEVIGDKPEKEGEKAEAQEDTKKADKEKETGKKRISRE